MGLNRYPKGVTGNPGGQTKAQARARRLAAEMVSKETRGGLELIEFAARVLGGAETGCGDAKSRQWACDFLANRLWGKAPLVVDVETVEAAPLPDLSGMSLMELRAFAAKKAAEAQGEVPLDDDAQGNVH